MRSMRLCGRRAFMWGAKSGKEQLPPFPEPTFAAGFACGVPKAALKCVVGFQSVEAFDAAHKMVLHLACLHESSVMKASDPLRDRGW